MNERKVILYISMSLDGFLATKEDDISWLSLVEKEGEDYGYASFTKKADTYLVGRKTYDVICNLMHGEFPQASQYKCFVLTREVRKNENGITFYSGPIEDLIAQLKSVKGKNIYCDGGAQIVKLLMDKNLIDEYIISVIPIILGEGKPLFTNRETPLQLKAKGCTCFDSGLIQLHYEKIEES